MIAVVIVQVLAATASCNQRCADESNHCYSSCGGQKACAHHCEDRSTSCNAGCTKQANKAEAAANAAKPKMPCGTKPGNVQNPKLQPCDEQQQKLMEAAYNSPQAKQALKCKDKQGRPGPCKSDAEAAKDIMKNFNKDDICVDSDGRPALCPEAKKRFEKQAQDSARNH
jgi:hypothetical protein